MEHRHLTGDTLSFPEISDIIGRGTLKDWTKLRDALLVEPALVNIVRVVCDAHLAMPEEDFPADYMFWRLYCTRPR